MSAPTPDEITAAHTLLLSVPGFTGRTTLADVAAILEPAALLAASLKDLLVERDVDIRDAHFMDVATLLNDLAARHGLRITTDPELGEVVGHVIGRVHSDGTYFIPEHDTAWNADDSDGARKSATHPKDSAFALVLLPEVGQS